MKEQQTQSKLSTRPAENRTRRSKDFPSKKSKKISNKSLNASPAPSSEESFDFWPFSEITEISEESPTEDARASTILQIWNKSLNPLFSEESVDFSPFSDITKISEENPTEDATTFLLEEPASVTSLQPEKIVYTTLHSTHCFEMNKFTGVEDTMNFLKHLKADSIVTSDNAGLQYKKLRDEIIEYVSHDLNRNVQPEDRSHTQSQSQLVSWKKPFLFLCVIICFIGVLAMLFFTPDVDCGLVPT
ncbi:hypothetical protein P8452_32858 [Trifolium repens]|nr:hypothetical protein P8452_32858 [Trifolium repens]